MYRSILIGSAGCVGSAASVFLNSALGSCFFLIYYLYYTLLALYNQFNYANAFIKEIYIMELEKKICVSGLCQWQLFESSGSTLYHTAGFEHCCQEGGEGDRSGSFNRGQRPLT